MMNVLAVFHLPRLISSYRKRHLGMNCQKMVRRDGINGASIKSVERVTRKHCDISEGKTNTLARELLDDEVFISSAWMEVSIPMYPNRP